MNIGSPAIFDCIGIGLLKESGVSLASEVSMRKITDEMIGDTLKGMGTIFIQLAFWWGRNQGSSSSVCTKPHSKDYSNSG